MLTLEQCYQHKWVEYACLCIVLVLLLLAIPQIAVFLAAALVLFVYLQGVHLACGGRGWFNSVEEEADSSTRVR